MAPKAGNDAALAERIDAPLAQHLNAAANAYLLHASPEGAYYTPIREIQAVTGSG